MKIILSKLAKKQLKSTPNYIQRKFDYWCDLINTIGLLESRKYKGFHDEALIGKRKGQRSVRLSKSYRVIYIEINDRKYDFIKIIEVNKHEY